ncbi:MAG: SH3 domain-containing protein [Chloroflexota bacterium]
MNKINRLTSLIVLMLILSACSVPSSAAQSNVASPTGSASRTVSTKTPTPHASTPSPVPTAIISPTQTSPAVTVTATKGNLFIRRGPDRAYNSISVLMDGQTAIVLGRDVLEKWLQISLPDHPEQTGWISIQTRYSVVNGDVKSLSVIEPTDWPVLASVRNCTYHEMRVDPLGIVITTADNFPWNDVQINPGVYIIHDIDAHGDPEVMEVEIKEGSQILIREDGDGVRWNCPTP